MTLRALSAALVAWFTAALIVPPMSVSAQEVTLRWKWVPGSELVYRWVESSVTARGPGATEIHEVTHTMRWSVSEVAPNGDATVTVTTEHIQLEYSGWMGDLSFDSRIDEGPLNPLTQMGALMAGQSFTLVVSPEGRVKSVRGLDQLVIEMFKAMDPEAPRLTAEMLRDIYTDEFVINNYQESIQIFPKEPVGPRGSWQHSSGVTMPGIPAATTTQTFTLVGFEEREGRTVAVVSGTGDMDFSALAGGPYARILEMTDTEYTGILNFDVDRGLTLSSSSVKKTERTVSTEGQQMAIGTVVTTILELIDYVSP